MRETLTAWPTSETKVGDTVLAGGTKRIVSAVKGWTVEFVDGLVVSFRPGTSVLGFR